jgi:hypothetical protein
MITYNFVDTIKEYDIEGHAAHTQKMRNVSMVLVGMPEDSKPLGNKDVNGGKILQ